MNRVHVGLLLALAWLAACRADSPSVPIAAPERPNILLLTAEDLSPRIGAFGDPIAITPHLDALAREGVRYPHTFTTSGVCAPSRAALITGVRQTALGAQHMRANGLRSYRAVPPAEVKAFPELLRAAGYFTFTTAKLDYQFSLPFPRSGPMTIWDRETYGYADWNGVPRGKPFYGQINYGVTHESGIFPLGIPTSVTAALLLPARLLATAGYDDVIDPAAVPVPPYYPDTPTVRRDIARHYENIRIMDTQVGETLAALERDGLADSTIVIWTTDHGDGLPRAKRELFDSGLRVPMIIRWPERFRPPGVEPGTIDTRLVSFVDLSATILSLAGVPRPPWMDGRVFAGPDPDAARQYVFAARDRLDEWPDRQRAVRDHRWKYIRNYDPGTPGARHLVFRDHQEIMQELWQLLDEGRLDAVQRRWFEPRPTEELYDTQADPDELVNLADDPSHRATLARLRGALDAWITERPDLGALPEAEMIEKHWPGGRQPRTQKPAVDVERIDPDRVRVTLTSPTHGASIRYRVSDGSGNTGAWLLYTGPVEMQLGHTVEARAVRYGWSESAATVVPSL